MRNDVFKNRFFIDTNVIIYSFDKKSPAKRAKAREVIAKALSSGLGIVSHQVVQEFISVAQSRFVKSFDNNRLILFLDEILFLLWKAYPSRELYLQALRLKSEFNFSWWDSLIVSSAIDTGCKYLLSEDFQDQQRIHSLSIINPF